MKFDMPVSVNFIIQTLKQHGYDAYIVGGCVRDSILGKLPHDYDICTDAKPDEIIKTFPDTIPTGIKHGTVTVLMNKIPYEVTTYRIDGEYTDNRHPDRVEFTNKLTEDLKRRDFTINAMAYNPDAGLIDPFDGRGDIERKIIKCVGCAEDRFNEDALRILRAVRFSSRLGFCIDEETDNAIHNQYIKLNNIAVERINSEFCGIVKSENFHTALLRYSDVFALFIPELNNMIGFEQNNPHHSYNVFEHTVYAVEGCGSDDFITRLAVFFHDFGKPHSYQDGEDGIRHFKGHGKVSADMTNEIMKRLKFDNDTRNKVTELVHYHDSVVEAEKKYIKRWLNKIGEEQFRRLLELQIADIRGQKRSYDDYRLKKIGKIKEIIDEVLNEKSCFSLKDLAVNGNDVKEIMNIKEGIEIGYCLNDILKLVINGELENSRECLISYLINQAGV